jgi:DNA repair exonuclease SbcCD nuclease subunit
VRIVAGHGAVDVLSPDRGDPARVGVAAARPPSPRAASTSGLGDRHSTTAVGASGRIWYPGAPEPTDFDEVDPGNALVVDLDADHCRVTSHPVGSWRFVEHQRELTGSADVAALDAWFHALPAKERTVVRLTLVGALGLAGHARLLDVLDHHGALLASLARWEKRSHLVVLPSDDDLGALDLHGFAARACDELLATARSGGEDAGTAADALALLHRLAVPS